MLTHLWGRWSRRDVNIPMKLGMTPGPRLLNVIGRAGGTLQTRATNTGGFGPTKAGVKVWHPVK